MNVAQRRTSATSIGNENVFILDRLFTSQANSNGVLTMSQDSSAPSGFANSLKLDCTTADTSIASAEILTIQHKIEGQNLQAFAKGTSDAKPFAVSFYVKGNASATYVCELFDVDNSRQISKSFNVTTDWTRVELSFPADTTGTFDDDNANSLQLSIWLHAGSTYTSGTLNSSSWASSTTANRVSSSNTSFFDSTDRTFFITGIQMEIGEKATEFEHEPYERTLAKCQRYYNKWLADTTYDAFAPGYFHAADQFYSLYEFPVQMRQEPTIGTGGSFVIHSGSDIACGSLIVNRATPSNMQTYSDQSGANGTALAGGAIRTNNDDDAYVECKAEL